MRSNGHFNRLPPDIRETILHHLAEHSGKQPISISQVVHILGERRLRVELSEAALKSSIAEAAIQRGFSVAFDGT